MPTAQYQSLPCKTNKSYYQYLQYTYLGDTFRRSGLIWSLPATFLLLVMIAVSVCFWYSDDQLIQLSLNPLLKLINYCL